ncbi:MAG: hypothetical protein HQL31_00950 [Planctomycetes bacterium]|nr:hypothetical protein [Planctomycetota bacterium]
MKNILSILVFIASAVGMVVLNGLTEKRRLADRLVDFEAPDNVTFINREKSIYTGGFDSVIADFMWMRNHLKTRVSLDQDAPKEERKAFELESAQRDLAAYVGIVSLDPTFEKAYDFSTLRLMVEQPNEAILLAKMAMRYCTKKKMDFAARAGHIASHVLGDHVLALEYYGVCVKDRPYKEFIGRQYLRTLLRTKGVEDVYDESPETLAKMVLIYYDAHKAIVSASTVDTDYMDPSETWLKPVILQKISELRSKPGADKVAELKRINAIYKELMTPPKIKAYEEFPMPPM